MVRIWRVYMRISIEAINLLFLHSLGFVDSVVYGVQTRIWAHDRNYDFMEGGEL